jgi:hypothetical protein
MSIITSTIAIVSTTAAIAATKISDIYPAKTAIGCIISSIYRGCIYNRGRWWIIRNRRGIIDCWRRRINCWWWILR